MPISGPFLSWAYFRDHWLSGHIMALPMLLACLSVARRGESRFLRVVAIWLAGLLAYLFFVLGPKFLDRNSGGLGKAYGYCVLIGPAFLYIQGGRLVDEMVAHEALEHQKQALF